MMNPTSWCVVAVVLVAGNSSKSTAFKTAFDKWGESSDESSLAAAEKAFDAWKAESPNDVAVWVACSNLRANQAARAPDEAAAGKRLDEAAACLKKGLTLAPGRLDVHFGLMAVDRMGSRWQDLESAAGELLAATKAHANELAWLDGKPLPKPVGEFVPENVLGYAQDERVPGDVASRLVAKVTDAFPDCGECWNTRGGFLLRRDDATKAQLEEGLGYLRKSAALLPQDLMVRTNLGINEIRAGHEAQGLKTLEAVLRENPDERQRFRAAQAAGSIWAKASTQKFHQLKLTAPQPPVDRDAGAAPAGGTIGGWYGQALRLMADGEDPKTVANAWCQAADEPPTPLASAAKMKAACTEWTKFAEKAQKAAEADLAKLKTFVANPKTKCPEARAAIFAWLESWPEAPEELSQQAFELYAQLKPCD